MLIAIEPSEFHQMINSICYLHFPSMTEVQPQILILYRRGETYIITRNNINNIIYRPCMSGRDTEDEIKAGGIGGVLSKLNKLLKLWLGKI